MAEGKKEYKQAKDNPFVVLADKLLQGGKGFKEAASRLPKETSRLPKETSRLPKETSRLPKETSRLPKERARLPMGKGDLMPASWNCAEGGNS